MHENTASRTAIIVAKSQALMGASPESGLPVDPESEARGRAELERVGVRVQ